MANKKYKVVMRKKQAPSMAKPKTLHSKFTTTVGVKKSKT